MTNKRRLLILAFGLLVLVALAFGFMAKHQPHGAKTTAPTGLEQGGPHSVGIVGDERLNDVLLSKQFVAVKQALIAYVLGHVGSSAIAASVDAGSTIVNADGSVNFNISVQKPAAHFTVLLQKPDSSTIIFSVPASGYSITLRPYGT